LKKQPALRLDYGNIKEYLADRNILDPSIKDVSDAVIAIRKSKLPDPIEIGNAGSFFKNPLIDNIHFEKLIKEFPEMPSYKNDEKYKIPAAWLIEKIGWKGFREQDYGVHQKQALVLVNYANAKGSDIFSLSERIITSVQQRFNILLEREVNIW
jgi:UDP-N-acetylmuramate dehydrogenase